MQKYTLKKRLENILINGRRLTPDWQEEGQLIMLDSKGSTLWQQTYYKNNFALVLKSQALFQQKDGFLIVTQRSKSSVSLVKISLTGELLQIKNIFLERPILIEAATQVNNGIAVVGIQEEAKQGQFFPPTIGKPFVLTIDSLWNLVNYAEFEKEGAVTDVVFDGKDLILSGTDTEKATAIARKVSLQGELIWESSLLSNLPPALDIPPKAWGIEAVGYFFYVVGNIEGSDFLVKLDTNGKIDQDWTKYYPWISNRRNHLISTNNTSGFAILGTQALNNKFYTYVIKIGKTGNSRFNRIEGTVVLDNKTNPNCIAEEGKTKLANVMIAATDEKGEVLFTTTDSLGYYYFMTDLGEYQLEVVDTDEEQPDSVCSEILPIYFEKGAEISKNSIVIVDEILLFNKMPPIGNNFRLTNSEKSCSPQVALTISPNPIKGSAHIVIDSPHKQLNANLELLVFNQLGQLYSSFKIPPQQSEVIIENQGWENGMYLFALKENGRFVGRKKVILAE